MPRPREFPSALYEYLLHQVPPAQLQVFLTMHYAEIVPHLPGVSVPAAQYAFDVVRALQQFGCIDDALFLGLAELRPRDADVRTVADLCTASGARGVRVAADLAERTRLWQGRKKAFGAMGRLAPHLVVQDAVVPRTRLPEVLARVHEIGEEHGVLVLNVFHAGDGNLHPNIPYDGGDAAQAHRVELAMKAIMTACMDAGGTITGEHGVGLDKLEYMDRLFDADSLAAMCRLREVFDPERRANPGKVVPVRSCREWHATSAARGVEPA